MSVLLLDGVRATAAGVLMARWSIDGGTATAALDEVAQDLGVDVDDLAALVVAAPPPSWRIAPPRRLSLVTATGLPEAAVGSDVHAATGADNTCGLTPREAQVLRHICDGLSNNDIAAAEYLSPNSIKTYIRSAYRKMGVKTRSQAILWGLDHGFRSGTHC